MDRKRIIRAIVFFIIGAGLMWWVFKDTNLTALSSELDRITWFWVGISVIINVFSQFIRGIRWAMLFKPLNYSPKTYNLFLSVLILAFTNQVIPRGGEIARLGVINRYDKIPFAKLLGTAFAERLTDLVILFLIFASLLLWQYPMIMDILAIPEVNFQDVSLQRIVITIAASVVGILLVLYLLKRFRFFHRLKQKIKKVKIDVKTGFKTIYQIKNKAYYFILSLLIYVLWFIMFFVLFYAYPPTDELGFKAAFFTFGLATLAFLLPIQSGMGAWHFIAIQALLIYGIDEESGRTFALMAHAVTNLIHLPIGAAAFVLLPLLNRNGLDEKD